MGRLQIRVIVTKSVCTDDPQPPPPISADKNVSFLLAEGEHLSLESFISCFQGIEGEIRVTFLHLAVFLVSLNSIILKLKWHIWGGMVCHPSPSTPYSTLHFQTQIRSFPRPEPSDIPQCLQAQILSSSWCTGYRSF